MDFYLVRTYEGFIRTYEKQNGTPKEKKFLILSIISVCTAYFAGKNRFSTCRTLYD